MSERYDTGANGRTRKRCTDCGGGWALPRELEDGTYVRLCPACTAKRRAAGEQVRTVLSREP